MTLLREWKSIEDTRAVNSHDSDLQRLKSYIIPGWLPSKDDLKHSNHMGLEKNKTSSQRVSVLGQYQQGLSCEDGGQPCSRKPGTDDQNNICTVTTSKKILFQMQRQTSYQRPLNNFEGRRARSSF